MPATPGAMHRGTSLPAPAASASQLYLDLGSSAPADGKAASAVELGTTTTDSDERPSRTRWRKGIRRVSQQSQILTLFKTLRDMHPEVRIDAECITPVQVARKKAVLGEGAFAVVEKCIYKPPGATVGRLVAVKRMKPELLTNELEITLFVKETDLLRKLKHRYIVEYVGVGGRRVDSIERLASSDSCNMDSMEGPMSGASSSGTVLGAGVFLVQELLEGGALRKKIFDAMSCVRKYSNADALRWAIHMARGLQYLHEAQPMVLHRDLKPDNVLLTSVDDAVAEAKICDFGLSALLPTRRQQGIGGDSQAQRDDNVGIPEERSSSELEAEWSQALTHATSMAHSSSTRSSAKAGSSRLGQSLPLSVAPSKLHLSGKTGSLMYMAPEMYKCEVYGCGVDVYSYAVVLFELFSRVMMMFVVCKRGLHEETEVYAQHVSNGYRPPLSNAVFANDLGLLISDCWAQDPEDRPSMAQVVERLTQIEASGVLHSMDLKLCGCAIS